MITVRKREEVTRKLFGVTPVQESREIQFDLVLKEKENEEEVVGSGTVTATSLNIYNFRTGMDIDQVIAKLDVLFNPETVQK